MKKAITVLFCILLLSVLFTASTMADPEEYKGQILPDFSADTINGTTFTLSESLKTHDLVLINFWATWCGPCCMEFPFLETAWEQYGDRVDVIALSIEGSDSFDNLINFASQYGLNFSIGRDESHIFDSMGGNAIPTTLIVDRNMQVVAVEIGSKSSVNEFTTLFDSLLSAVPAQKQQSVRCIMRFVDESGCSVPGVGIGFCNGEYTPIKTDSNGCVTFDGNPSEYHVHLLSVPDGYSMPWEQMQITGNSFDITVVLCRNY